MKARRVTRLWVWAICAVMALTAGGAIAQEEQAERPQRVEPTSETNDRLARWLKQWPEADANGDGVLTLTEARAYRHSQSARRVPQDKTQGQQSVWNPLNADRRNVSYGPHERNVLNFWQARTDEPAPVVVFFHGGGFSGGSKTSVAPYLRDLQPLGVSVASANYRLVTGKGAAPFPAPMHDGARVVQFLRHNAKEWNIDPRRIALMGSSAGACMSLWIALHDDLADPGSDDPVARQSSRVSCVVSLAGQTFLDPVLLLQVIGGDPSIHPSLLPFYGAGTREDLEKPEFRALIEEASALNHATKDDPPVYLTYGGRIDDVPLPEDTPVGKSIHHPMFGKVLKDKLDGLGVECHLTYNGSPVETVSHSDFLKKHLGLAK